MDVSGYLGRHGPVARRADLLRSGFRDTDIGTALRARRILRVRHGWYAVAGTAEPVLRAVRVGGVVTGIEALRLRGLFLPRPARVDIAVPRHASGLRRPTAMRQRLRPGDQVRIHWISSARRMLRSRDWLATEDDALVVVLHTASRELAVAACDAVVRYLGWDDARLDAAFSRAPRRVQGWRALVDGRADAWGETAVRLRLRDAGIAFEPQARVDGVGRFDGRVSPGVFVEVDGAQHDELWAGPEPSSFERDHLKDLGLALRGARSIRITYGLFESRWDECLAAIRAAIELDVRARSAPAPARRARVVPRAPRKLRKMPQQPRVGRANRRPTTQSPQFSNGPDAAAPRANPRGRGRPPTHPAARSPNVRR